MAEQKCQILGQGFCVLCLVLTLLFGIIAAIIAPLIASSFIEVEAIQKRPGTATAFATSLALHDAKLRQQQKELELYAQLYNPGLLNGQLGPIGPTGLTMHGGPTVHVGAPPIIHNIQWHQGSPEKEWLNAQEASNPAMPPVGWSERQSAIANGKVITQNSIVRWRGNPVPVGVGGTLNNPQTKDVIPF
ncbi:unnamed protein product, partial [Mesorhabditis belari]|uniref:Uncharacterized protein n=1 Tax=Mesorhabditis belari TaxID=2138241 RepID=A0AAF3J8W7_9BILA